jgi:adenosine/AMP kinase
MTMDIKVVKIDRPDDMNFILGQAHFIKTVEDIHEAIVNTAPQMKFGIAFCESSGPALVRYSGNNDSLIELAKRNALNIAAGHSFIIFMENGFPVNILNTIKNVPEVCRIFCATANPVEVVIAETETGRGILGVIDGVKTKGVEGEADIKWRKEFLRKIGYKF